MYLNLLSEVTIRKVGAETPYVITRAIQAGEIVSSWKEITDTCELVLPRNLMLKYKRLDQVIEVGDAITVKLSATGFNGLVTEFEGYVREVEPTIPLVIRCEDEMWKLKRLPVIPKSWAKAEIAEVIKHIAPDVPTKVFGGISTSVSIGKFQVNNKSAAQVLADLREYGIFSYFRKRVLHVGFAYDYNFNKHTLHFQRNIRSNDLKFRLKDDYKIQVKAVANLPTGQKTIELYPDDSGKDSELHTLNFGELSEDIVERRKLLRKFAQARIKQFNVDGYRGTITTFGIPAIEHGDTVVLKDGVYPERESSNIVDRVVKSWGEVYYKRVCEIGPRAVL